MKVLRELKCRVGLHRLVAFEYGTGLSWSECYQSDYCRGRSHKKVQS